MIKKLPGSHARQLLGGLTLSAFAVAAQADPFSLQGACRLTSAIPAGGAQCQLDYTLTDAQGAQTSIKGGTIRIDNILVHRYVNDSAHPVPITIFALIGSPTVACGVSHTVVAFITKVGVGTVPTQVGSLPPVLCPTVP